MNTGACSNEAPRKNGISRSFLYGLGFSGKHGFIYFNAVGFKNNTVRRNLVTGAECDDVINYYFFHAYGFKLAVSVYPGFGRSDDRKLIDKLFYPDFLKDAYNRVADHNSYEKDVFYLSGNDNQKCKDVVKDIEIGDGMGTYDLSDGPLVLAFRYVDLTQCHTAPYLGIRKPFIAFTPQNKSILLLQNKYAGKLQYCGIFPAA